MAEWLPLAQLAVRPQAGRVFALAGEALRDHADFRAQAARWRACFAAQPGQTLALYFEDAAACAPALYGAWHAGKTVLLCADALPATLLQLRDQVQAWVGDVPLACAPLQAPDAFVDDGAPWPALDEAACRLLIQTSGSTGAPSLIEKTLGQLAREVEALQAAFGAQLQGASVYGTVSHQHIYGLLFRLLWPLAAGRAIAPRLFFHEEIAATLRGPSVLVTSPAHLKRIPASVDFQAARAALRAVFSSGGTLPEPAAIAAQEAFGQAPIEVYGSSETGGIAWRQAGTPWQALPGVRWRINEGQLEVASPHLPDARWWRSADRVEAVDGGFRLLGRADRIVKVEERRVSLTALEQQLGALVEVAEARVLLLDGARAELAAVIVPSALGAQTLQQVGTPALTARLRQALADCQDAVSRPRRWRFVEALPMNAQGKTTEAALRALFQPLLPSVQWLQRAPAQARLQLSIDPQLQVFDGHFPETPILPGVAQLDWAVQFGRQAFAIPARFLRMEVLKFQRIVRPGMQLTLELDWQPEAGALVFRYHSAQGPHASGRVLFASAQEPA